MATLFGDVRSEQNIFAAWRHVKRSALHSNNMKISGMASEFDHEHQRYLRRFATQLREGRFKFDPVDGVLKDKSKRIAQGKEPRPIVISTLKSRVVQRAILQVLQPRKLLDARNPDSGATIIHDPRLGRINDINRSRFGVGGLIYPYGGVEPAIKSIRAAIDGGARYFFSV
jgi:RNA-directed DNA polymerase